MLTIRKKILLVFLMIFCMIMSFVSPLLTYRVYAVVRPMSKDTDVIDDLSIDPEFNLLDYPANDTDYSLKVIQFAEGETGDLYLYVYQPAAASKEILATSVNISDTGNPTGLRECELTLVDSEGVFQKYRIETMYRGVNLIRKYLIVSLFRDFDPSLGDQTSGSHTIGVKKAIPVECIWTASTDQAGNVTYRCDYTEDTIQVTSQTLGYLVYEENNVFNNLEIQSHYLGFSTNKPMDSILEANLNVTIHRYYINGSYNDDSEEVLNITILKDDIFEIPDQTWLAFGYEHKRIQEIDDFLKFEGVELSYEAEKALSSEKWIFRYLETDHVNEVLTDMNGGVTIIQRYTDIVAVNLFRLKYEYRDKIYNVGVIADIMTEDDIPDGKVNIKEDQLFLFRMLIFALVLAFICIVYPPFFSFLQLLFKGLIFLLELVFEILTAIIKILFMLLKLLFRLFTWFFE